MEYHHNIANSLIDTIAPRFLIIMLQLPYGIYDNIPIDEPDNIGHEPCFGELNIFIDDKNTITRHLQYCLHKNLPGMEPIHTHFVIKNNNLFVTFTSDKEYPEAFNYEWNLDQITLSDGIEEFCEIHNLAMPSQKNIKPSLLTFSSLKET